MTDPNGEITNDFIKITVEAQKKSEDSIASDRERPENTAVSNFPGVNYWDKKNEDEKKEEEGVEEEITPNLTISSKKIDN